jgi:hypothetical protein
MKQPRVFIVVNMATIDIAYKLLFMSILIREYTWVFFLSSSFLRAQAMPQGQPMSTPRVLSSSADFNEEKGEKTETCKILECKQTET